MNLFIYRMYCISVVYYLPAWNLTQLSLNLFLRLLGTARWSGFDVDNNLIKAIISSSIYNYNLIKKSKIRTKILYNLMALQNPLVPKGWYTFPPILQSHHIYI